jgi:ferrous iron transport protein B
MKSTHKPLVALIGNPNCGKTTLFNQLTGLNKKTGNWSGVTVDSQYCAVNYNDLEYNLVDLPGIYGLSIEGQGQDESHVQEFLQNQKPDIIINVINSASLERGLFLTFELLEFNIPVITILNMWDEAQVSNLLIDTKKLSKKLNNPVLNMVAIKGIGVDELKQKIKSILESPLITSNEANTKETLTFEELLEQSKLTSQQVKSQSKRPRNNKQNNKLDFITTHPILGMLSFLVAMYIMFFFAINVSAIFVDFFDIATGAIFINGGHQLLNAIGLPEWLVVILADGVGGGVQTVATFIPVIGFLYLVLTWLEDSGYMARAAFVMNGVMEKIGLSGQAFVPLIVSFGCNVPAIMATRTLPSKRERLVTIMMAPFMSCGARLSVYALFVAAFFTQHASLIVLGLYLIGILLAVLTGLMLQKTILPGRSEPFLIELPPWRIPTLKNLLIGTWRRLKGFLLDAGKIIVIMVMLIQVLNSIGKDLSWGNQDSENSLLSYTAKSAIPIFEPMGIEEKNWPAIVGILTGVLAKEVVVGTLDALYTSLDKESNKQEPSSIKQELYTALVSIKDNTLGLADLILDPLGLSITQTGSEENMAETQGVNESLFGIIRDRFSDKYAAFAYLLFILLYFPCVAATAAISREASIKWAIFSGAWSTGLAYFVAVNFYQLSHFRQNPMAASIWLVTFICVVTMVYFYLKKVGKEKEALRLKVI